MVTPGVVVRPGEVPSPTAERRLKSRLTRTANGCLEWTGAKYKNGYGKLYMNGRVERTSRVAWAIENGPIPEGVVIRHRCDNPPCCDPTHLVPGSLGDNNRDTRDRGRHGMSIKTHCPSGHAYTADNTYLWRGFRHCRACRRARY